MGMREWLTRPRPGRSYLLRYPCPYCPAFFRRAGAALKHVERSTAGAAREQRELGNPEMAERIERQAAYYRRRLSGAPDLPRRAFREDRTARPARMSR